MARSYLCGFEMGDVHEAFSVTGSPTLSTSIVHSGARALQVNNPGVATYVVFTSRVAGGTFRNLFRSCRFYLYIVTLPTSTNNSIIWSIGPQAGTPTSSLRLSNAGVMALIGSGGTQSGSRALETGVWHRIEVDIGSSGAVGSTNVYLDGVADITCGFTDSTQPEMRMGQGVAGAETETANLVFDDVLADDTTFASSGLPGAGLQTLLIPTAGNNAASWTDGAGGTGDIHAGVANIPPIGVAASTANAKIKNAASGGNLDYVATMQTYLVGGVPAGSTINAVMSICNDGEEITTSTKAGGIWCASNPSQSAGGQTFDYGDDTSTAVGTFPTGWGTHVGVVAVAPSVTLGTAPTVTVRKTTSTTRVVDVDFMGLYVDYTPPPIGKLVELNQAVNRASTY